MTPTLEAVEQLVNQLSEQDQMALAKRLGIKFLALPPAEQQETVARTEVDAKRLQLAEHLLAEVADIEDDSQGTSDSVEILRCIREGRRHNLTDRRILRNA